MQVRDIMTQKVDCCTPETALRDVAMMMANEDVGSIPVVDDRNSMKPVGIVTDRDITCRIVAKGQNPLDKQARDAMSPSLTTIRDDMDVDRCLSVMEQKQIRRVPVIDQSGKVCGIIAQADIALKAQPQKTAELVKDVSKPAHARQPQHAR
jgi:CBS domain-containing protein